MGSDRVAFVDVLMMNKHYGCTSNCASPTVECANGGYPNPRNCNRCTCPHGFGGRLCQVRVRHSESVLNFPFQPSGCGAVLYADASVQTLTQTLGDGTTTIQESIKQCFFHIVVDLKTKPKSSVTGEHDHSPQADFTQHHVQRWLHLWRR